MHQFYAPRLPEIDHGMEQIAVAAEICVIIASQSEGQTVGDSKMPGRTADIATVEGIDGILEMELVGGSVFGTGLGEYLSRSPCPDNSCEQRVSASHRSSSGCGACVRKP